MQEYQVQPDRKVIQEYQVQPVRKDYLEQVQTVYKVKQARTVRMA